MRPLRTRPLPKAAIAGTRTATAAGSRTLPAGAGARPLDRSETVGVFLDELERKMERLRALYETYFLGTERRAPEVARHEVARLIAELQKASVRNAGMRFRAQSLQQRWVVLTTYWGRTMREIEAGTYQRHLQQASRRIAARGAPLTAAEAAAIGVPAARIKAVVSAADPATPDEDPSDTPGED